MYIGCWLLAAIQTAMGIFALAFTGIATIITLWVRRIFGFLFAIGGILFLIEQDWYGFFSVAIITAVFYLIPHTSNAIAAWCFVTSALLFAAPIVYSIHSHKNPIQYIEDERGSGNRFSTRC